MTTMVKVSAGDRAVKITRDEAHGGEVILQPGQHETFTVRAHEAITIEGDLKNPAAGDKPPEGSAVRVDE